jgi:molybdopterin synthase catalytic subunit
MASSQEDQPWHLSEGPCYVALTHDHLNAQEVMDRVRSPAAGAIVLFAGISYWNSSSKSTQPAKLTTLVGTTRDNFAGKPVKELHYSAYNALALRSMLRICQAILQKHSLQGITMVHRLGTCPIGEESILIAVSAPHRQAAWRAGEEALEECKAKVEIWKREEFEGEEGVWRANRDGAIGQKE